MTIPQNTVLRNFKGLDTFHPASLVDPDRATVADNVEVEKGTIRRREGWTKIHTADLGSGTSDAVDGLFAFYFQTTRQLLATAGRYLMRSTGGDFTTISSTFVATAPARPTFTALADAAYIAVNYGSDLTTDISKWDGSTLTTITASPIGSIITNFNGALWLAGDTAAPSRLYFSGQAGGSTDQDDWPALNFINVEPGDGDKITGLATTLNALIVFKERSIHRIIGFPPEDAATDTGDLQVNSLFDQPGCIAPRTVAALGNKIMYLNRKGLYMYDGVQSIEVSQMIRPFFDTVDQDNIKYAVGNWVSPTQYILSLLITGGTRVVLSVHISPELNITKWTGFAATAIERFIFSTTGVIPVYGFAGAVGSYGGNTDNGTTITWLYKTGANHLGFPQYSKILRRGQVRGKVITDATVTFKAYRNFTTSSASKTIDFTAVGTEDDIATRRVITPGIAKAWEFEFSGSTTGASPEIYELTEEFLVRRIG